MFTTIFLVGCESLNDLESDCVGNWKFSDFGVVNSKTYKSVKYSNLDNATDGELKSIVNQIGTFYSGLVLNLYNIKTEEGITGTYERNGNIVDIKWQNIDDGSKLYFENFTILYINGTTLSRTNSAYVLLGDNSLVLCCIGGNISNYITFIKN